jgi:signal transduction histidine kinase
MAPRSLRWHLLVGSILWTIGLLFVAHLLAVHLFHYFFGPGMVVLRRETFRTVAMVMSLFALVLMAAGYLHVRRGLAALDRLRVRLGEVREGRAERLGGDYPAEVQPLAADLDALLDQREEAVSRALGKAGDLAHGLKTPLAVLTQEAERLAAAGEVELAAALRHELERMRRQIDYHLAHARAAGAGATLGARCDLAEAAAALARTLEHIHAERGISITIDVRSSHAARCQREDFDEMLGNLLDNACKWARSRVAVASELHAGEIVLVVDDDGPGLAAELRQRVLQRGVRADEAAPGSGLGLAIVRDLAELYGGSIALDDAPAGGLRARLVLPAA